jgi:hypothetical protein
MILPKICEEGYIRQSGKNMQKSPIEPYRLAIVSSHPVQYHAPLFQQLACEESVNLTVYYGDDRSVKGYLDKGFGVAVQWDRPLLQGYESVFLSQKSPVSRWHQLWDYARLFQHLRKGQYDAVWVNGYSDILSLVAHLSAWVLRIPTLIRAEPWMRPEDRNSFANVMQTLGAESSVISEQRLVLMRFIKEKLKWLVFKRARAIFSIGQASHRLYTYYGVPEKKLFRVPYCVDNTFLDNQRNQLILKRTDLRQELGFDTDTIVIVFSGKMIEHKRPFDLLHAYHHLIDEGLPVGLLFIGDGEQRNALQTYTETHALPRVVFAGFQNQTQLGRYYVCGDVFSLPTLSETWGLVLNEAMLFEMPVITTQFVGAAFDLIQTGQTGYIYPVGNIDQLTNDLRSLVFEESQRQSMGQRARSLVLNQFDNTVGIKNILHALAFVSRDKH